MSGNGAHLLVFFLQFTPLEEMKSTLTSAGFTVVNEKLAGYNILTVSVPTDRPEDVELERTNILALPNVAAVEVIGIEEIPERRQRPATGAENPEKFKSGVGK